MKLDTNLLLRRLEELESKVSKQDSALSTLERNGPAHRDINSSPRSTEIGDMFAALSAANGSPSQLRAMEASHAELRGATPFPEDALKLIDDVVVRVGRSDLVLVNDLIEANLVRDLPEWLSVPELGYDTITEAGRAKRSMELDVRGETWRGKYGREIIPIWATWDNLRFGIRELEASRRIRRPLDTAHAEQAVRNVNEAVEDQGWNGIDFNVNGYSAPGILTDPDLIEEFVDNESWTASGHSGEDILGDVTTLIQAAVDNNRRPPFNLYIPTTYGIKLLGDFKANSTTTIRQRLEEIDIGNNQKLRIRVAPQLTGDNVALVPMQSTTIDLINGQEPVQVNWTSGSGWTTYIVILACQIVRVKRDSSGSTGIVIGRPNL